MSIPSLSNRPWLPVAAGGAVLVAAVETFLGAGPGGIAVALAGALTGVIVLPAATQAGLIAGALALGLRVRHIVIGARRRIASFEAAGVTVTVRSLPVVLASEIGPWRKPVVLRSWLAGLVSALAGLGVVAAAWLLCAGPFGRGFVVAVTGLMAYKLVPRRAPVHTSTGWLLFGLPRMSEQRRREFGAAAQAARAHEALSGGDVARAQAVVDELAAEHPHLHTTVSCRVTLHEARGEYAAAVALLLGHISTGEPDGRQLPYTLAGLAGLGFSAVEAGQLDASDVLPIAEKALHDSIELGFPAFELSGTSAIRALLREEPQEAARLAALGAEHGTSPLSRADALATLARARMILADNAGARRALREAELLAAWWPRVRAVHTRLTVA